jgi:hypothetical protein
VGVIHVHTDASDGGGTLDQVLDAAAEADLDFVILTDHNLWGAPAWRWARDSVLLVVGEEVSTPYGHLLTLGPGPVGSRRTAHPRPEADGPPPPHALPTLDRHPLAVAPGEGLRIVAHPTGRTAWKAWGPGHFEGIEIWNADSERRGDSAGDWVHALALLPFRPQAALFRLLDFPTRELALFDALLAQGRDVFGICGVDAHHTLPLRRDRSIDLHFPAYRHSFDMARQHVRVPPVDEAGSSPGESRTGTAADPAVEAGQRLLTALREGRSYCAFDGLSDARGARFRLRSGARTAGLGESVPWTGSATLAVSLPPSHLPTTVRVLRDGEEVARRPGSEFEVELPGPGIYRVEATVEVGRRTVPWILTNPLRLTPAPGPEGEDEAPAPIG